jgi:hypothetical protein
LEQPYRFQMGTSFMLIRVFYPGALFLSRGAGGLVPVGNAAARAKRQGLYKAPLGGPLAPEGNAAKQAKRQGPH